MMRATQRAQRGGECAHALLAWIFRIAIFATFAPIAFHCLMRGQLFECACALVIACYLGALLAPGD